MLLAVSALGILIGTAFVMVSGPEGDTTAARIEPQRRGCWQRDYSQRVQVASSDECGELAAAFNQMTENVKRSREQLEQTVIRSKRRRRN